MNTEFRLFGSYSNGTLRREDLLPAFADAAEDLPKWLEKMDPERATDLRNAAADALAHLAATDDVMADALAELDDAINAHNPEGVYFGSHEGDGADFGFWVSSVFLDDIREDDDIRERVEVSDHGNVTLFDRPVDDDNRRIVWAIV